MKKKMFLPWILSLLLFLLNSSIMFGIYPYKHSWQQKNSEHFKVIFQKGNDSQANELINFLEHHYKTIDYQEAPLKKQFPFILHNQTGIMNGFVSWLPRRSELFTLTSPQDHHFIGNNSWLNLLAIHEYRHIAQQELALSKDDFKFLYTFTGEITPIVLINLYMPLWYFEGDAVISETKLTNYGRGKEANFTKLSRMQSIEYGPFHFNKQILGSFKYLMPNHYENGYILLHYLLKTYGQETYDAIINKTYQLPLFNLSLNKSIKNETGLSLKTLYKHAFNDLKQTQLSITPPKDNNSTELLPTLASTYHRYLKTPKQIDSKTIIVHESSLDDIEQFIAINPNGKTKKLVKTGTIKNHTAHGISKQYLAWIKEESHLIFSHINYSNIVLYDIKKDKIISKTKESFFDSVAISTHQNKIVALKQYPLKDPTLSILTIPSLETETQIELKNGTYSYVHFIENDTALLALKTVNEEKNVITIDLKTGNETVLYSTYENIGTPLLHNNQLIINLSYKNNDRLLLIDLNDKKRYIFAESDYGSYNPSISVDQNHVLYNTFVKNGFNIMKKPLTSTPLKEISYNEPSQRPINLTPNQKKYKTTSYQAWKQYIKPINYLIFPDKNNAFNFQFDSFDTLNHVYFKNLLTLDLNENTYSNSTTILFQKYFPILGADHTLSSQKTILFGTEQWNEQEIGIYTIFPLSKTLKNSSIDLTLTPKLSTLKLSNYTINSVPSTLINDSLTVIHINLSIDHIQESSFQGVKPRWFQTLSTEIKETTPQSKITGSYKQVDIKLGFPGLKKSHSLRQNFQILSQTLDNYIFETDFSYIEGYSTSAPIKTFIGTQFEYEYPALYPEINLTDWMYILRIRMSHFLHLGQIEFSNETKNLLYLGTRFHFDSNYLQRKWVYLSPTLSVYYSPEENNIGALFNIEF